MIVAEPKIAKQLSELKPLIVRESRELTAFRMIEQDVPGAYRPDFDDSGWRDFRVGDEWGGYDVTAWFRGIVEVPDGWSGEKVALQLRVGPRDGGESAAEALLYAGGEPLQGIDEHHEEAWLPPKLLAEGRFPIAIKAWSGVPNVPERRRFRTARLVRIDGSAERFYYMADTVLKAVDELAPEDLRRTRLLRLLDDSIRKLDWRQPQSNAFYESVGEALAFLSDGLAGLAETKEIRPKVIGVGHSHIDMAWLWRLSHTREKAARTFSTVLHLMSQYPEFRYLHTSPQLYRYLKEDYPELFAKVREKIASGEWEISGAMWVEPDTNVPNGESLIRHILLGKAFIRDEFGQETNLVRLPDVSGHTWALPQIVRKSGIERLLTSKTSRSSFNRFPYDTFVWRGIDGTELLTHFVTTPEEGGSCSTYNGSVDPRSVKGLWDEYRQKDVNEELLLPFGWGDGVGGPTKDMLEAGRALASIPGLPQFEFGKAEPFFDRLAKRLENAELPVWDGELYLESRRGTYTSHGWIKRANRKAETLYHHAEWFNVVADLLTGGDGYPAEALRKGWELLLLNQFHDILPGTSLRQVYEDAREHFREIADIGEKALDRAERALLGKLGLERDSVVVFNSLSWERRGVVELPLTEAVNGKTILGSDGSPARTQIVEEDGGELLLVEVEDVPAMGYAAYALVARPLPDVPSGSAEGDDRGGGRGDNELNVSRDSLENAFFRIRLNEQGQIESLYDKRARREVLAEDRPGNVLQTFEDRPLRFDAGDIDIDYREKMTEIGKLAEAVVEEEGPVRGVLRLVWTFGDSRIVQRLTVYRSVPRIDFRTEVDWREKRTLLKAAFPVDIRATRATYDIQFGAIERPTHWNTSGDRARFEVCAHKWADLSEGGYGVSLLNDCKYGYDVKDGVMRLTLIKSPVLPDETADQGRHTFTYSLYPHFGDWRYGQTPRAAYDLNVPLQAAVAGPGSGALPYAYSFVSVDADHVFVETVKQAEAGDCAIVRVYEAMQCRNGAVTLRFGQNIRKAAECNLVEEGEEQVEFAGAELTFPIRPYEIKTFKVWF
ncbi:alpha-mannosidase [Paenibacillus flagellatus]|nr:alpha-mannosidase [Paenibacillus flagellatus]